MSDPALQNPIRNDTQATAAAQGVDLGRLPVHIAMIMDGNGRWAEGQGFDRLMGHQEGYRSLRTVLLDCSELGVRYLTVYAFSVENWRRPADEVEGLMALIEQAARNELRLMHQNNVRVRVSGRIDEVPQSLKEALLEGVETTKDNTGITFTLAINYGGRAEIVDAVRSLIRDGVPAEQIDEEVISSRMYNPDIPDPDVLIRTAGEMRWSNFLLWEGAYAELVVTEKSWPEFDTQTLIACIAEFQSRTRKFGAVVRTAPLS